MLRLLIKKSHVPFVGGSSLKSNAAVAASATTTKSPSFLSNQHQSIRLYHATSFVPKGRLNGANAFDMGYRELSKKQKKRKRRLKELRLEKNEQKDPAKEKIKNEHMEKQYASPEFQSYIANMKLRLIIKTL